MLPNSLLPLASPWMISSERPLFATCSSIRTLWSFWKHTQGNESNLSTFGTTVTRISLKKKKLSTGCLKKNVTMFVCFIFPKPINPFLNNFFPLKTEIHMFIFNIEPVLCYFRELKYLQNKTGFRNRQVHIHTDLKWSSQPQSGLGRPRQAREWPGR